MRVKMLVNASAPGQYDTPCRKGEVHDLPDDLAQRWLSFEFCIPDTPAAGPVESAAVQPPEDAASRTAPPDRRET
jgi:hypothetical protein